MQLLVVASCARGSIQKMVNGADEFTQKTKPRTCASSFNLQTRASGDNKRVSSQFQGNKEDAERPSRSRRIMTTKNTRTCEEKLLNTAEVVEPHETRGSRIHVTLRLAPETYKQILRYKKATKAPTMTASIEALVEKALNREKVDTLSQEQLFGFVRSLAVRIANQDMLLKILADRVKPKDAEEKLVVDRYTVDADSFLESSSGWAVDRSVQTKASLLGKARGSRSPVKKEPKEKR